MKPFDFIAVKITLLLVLGILLGDTLGVSPSRAACLSLLFLGLLGITSFWHYGHQGLFVLCVILSTLFLGAFFYSLAIDPNQPDHYSHRDATGDHLWHLKIRESGKPTQYNQPYVTRVIALDRQPAQGKIQILVKLRASENPLKVDDEILVWGKAERVGPPRNPYHWDYSNYLKNRNIYHQIHADHWQIHRLKHSGPTLKGRAERFRNMLLTTLKQADFGEKELGIIQALVLGQRKDITPETLRQYQRAGAVHILAISGLHIGIILLLLRFAFRPLNRFARGRQLALFLAILVLWVYALLTGLSPSVIRATTMFSFLAYAIFLNRLTHGYNTLALSMFFLLIIVDPLLIFQAGFQMSYAAVMAILWIHPVLNQLWKPRPRTYKRIWQLITVSFAAQLGVLPISLFYFHQFPLLFLACSLVIVPALGLILGSGLLVTFLAQLHALPGLLAKVVNFIVVQLNTFISALARQDAFFLENLSFDQVDILLAYALIFFLVIWISKPNAARLSQFLFVLILVQACGIFRAYQTRQTSRILILHQTGNPVLFHQSGPVLGIHSPEPRHLNTLVKDFRIGARIRDLEYFPLRKQYRIKGTVLTRLDGSGVTFPKKHGGMLWLTDSPRINLDRYLAYRRPEKVIADGSNYHYLVRKWRQSCSARNIPFHYTGDSGAFTLDLSP